MSETDSEGKSTPRCRAGEPHLPASSVGKQEAVCPSYVSVRGTSAELRYQTEDLSARAIVHVFLALAVLMGLAGLGVWSLFRWSLSHEPTSPLPKTPATLAGQAPALQFTPADDLVKLRTHEDRILRETRWLDRQAGIARIPIDQAMALLAQRAKAQRRERSP